MSSSSFLRIWPGIHAQVLGLGAVVRPPHLLQDRRVRQHTAGIPGEQRQERELLRREVDDSLADRHGAAGEVDAEITDDEHAVLDDRVGGRRSKRCP